jgi:hypothetical protein
MKRRFQLAAIAPEDRQAKIVHTRGCFNQWDLCGFVSLALRKASIAFLTCLYVCVGAQNYYSRAPQIEQRILECRTKISQLLAQKEQALEELRHGYFCSKCKRSKSEIERAERISFEKHLQDVKGQAVASPGQLSEKAAFYDRQIAALQNQIAQLEAMKGQMASVGRQQADLERQRQQRDREQARLREMQAQQQKLQQERDRIVNRAKAKADGYQRAGQAAADGIQQIGNVLLQKMEQDRQEREQQRAQERYDRQMERLQQQIQAQEQQLANVNNDSTASGGDIELPAPVQIYEPPGEGQQQQMAEDQIRETGVAPTVVFRDGQSFTRDFPAYDSGGVAPVTRFPATPYEPPQRLGDYLSTDGSKDNLDAIRKDNDQWHHQAVAMLEKNEDSYRRNSPYNGSPPNSDNSSSGDSSLFDGIGDRMSAAQDRLREFGRSVKETAEGAGRAVREPAKETLGTLFDEIKSGDPSTVSDAARSGIQSQWQSVRETGIKNLDWVAMNWAKQHPLPSQQGKTYDEIAERDRTFQVLREVGEYAASILKHNAKEAGEAYERFVKKGFLEPLSNFLHPTPNQHDDDLFEPSK